MTTLNKHYAVATRPLARQFTNHLKSLGYETTQPRSKAVTRKGVLTMVEGVKALQGATTERSEAYLVSHTTKIKKPTTKKFIKVVNNKAVMN